MDGTIKNRRLSELRKDIILTELASGKTVAQVSREIGCNATHIHAWLKDYPGVERLETALRDARHRLETRLPDLVEKSLDVLEQQLNAAFMSDAKMAAAKTILQTVTKLSVSKNRCEHCEGRAINHQSLDYHGR